MAEKKEEKRARYRNKTKVNQIFVDPVHGKIIVVPKGTILLPESVGRKHLTVLERVE